MATEPSIVCPHCGRRSYHPQDISQRYCAVCGFHDGSLRKAGPGTPEPDADLVLMKLPERIKIAVAVYWPEYEEYGGGTRCDTIEQAKRLAREDLASGYGRTPKNHVHIVETTTRIIDVRVADLMPARSPPDAD